MEMKQRCLVIISFADTKNRKKIVRMYGRFKITFGNTFIIMTSPTIIEYAFIFRFVREL